MSPSFQPQLQHQLQPQPQSAQKPVTCNCKRSKCLKLYCDCFRFSKYCFGCRCHDCSNSVSNYSPPARYSALNKYIKLKLSFQMISTASPYIDILLVTYLKACNILQLTW
jgi:hypothetical protein